MTKVRSYKSIQRRRRWSGLPAILAALAGLAVAALLLLQIPRVQRAVEWRYEYARVYINSVFNPVGRMPTPAPVTPAVLNPSATPTPGLTLPSTALPPAATATITPTPQPAFTPTPLPGKVELPAPKHELEDLNNCGPATLAMYLRFYGWEGDQYTISDKIKPIKGDRNVNVEELTSYVLTDVKTLNIEYRVGGNLDKLRALIAANIPVMIEGSFMLDKSFIVNDDRWAGHYLLVTGYDDATQRFTVQDSERGPNRSVPYETLRRDWQSFNYVYIMLFPYDKLETVKSILGPDWDLDTNRQNALTLAQQEAQANPNDAYAWFNQGTNLSYFQRYTEAVPAYDTARRLGLPLRMLRYQFGPFMAYFHTNRIEDLMALTDYALKITPNSEEALLWRGWALYRLNRRDEALESFNKALEARPNYGDALYAINFVANN